MQPTQISSDIIPHNQYEKFARSVHGIALLKKHDSGAPACNICHGNHGAARYVGNANTGESRH
jgi:hypothetical protein